MSDSTLANKSKRCSLMVLLLGGAVACGGQTDRLGTLVVGAHLPLTKAANGVDGEVQLLKDGRITAGVAKQVWETGALEGDPERVDPSFKQTPARNAEIRIIDRHGNVIDSEELERPLARIGTARLYTGSRLTFLVTVDYSAGFGSYSGPMTFFTEVSGGHMRWLEAVHKDNERSRITVMSSLKTAWRVADAEGGGKEILEAACRPSEKTLQTGNDFRITYSRYFFDGTQWKLVSRTVPGFTEFDEGFPSRRQFP